MNIKDIFTTAVTEFNRHLPEILTGLGVTGVVATGYFTYKSAKKMDDIVTEVEEKRANDLPVNRMEEVIKITKTMALPVALGATSIACIIASYQIQNNRINILSGAVSVLGAEAAKFRDKYKEEHGTEEYRKFMQPTKREVVSEEVDEEGNVKQITETVPDVVRPTYGVWFSESEEYVLDDHPYNISFIREAIKILELKSFQETLSLNQVYRALGISETRQGAQWGFERNTFTADFETHAYQEGNIHNDIFILWPQPVPLFSKGVLM